MGRPRKVSIDEFRQTNGKAEVQTASVKDIVSAKPEEVKPVEAPVTEKKQSQYVIHGALTSEAAENISNLLKRVSRSPFSHWNTPQEYSSAINKMQIGDLHRHAIEVSIIPTTDKDKLIKQLETAYGVYANRQIPKSMVPSNLTADAAKNIQEILAKRVSSR